MAHRQDGIAIQRAIAVMAAREDTMRRVLLMVVALGSLALVTSAALAQDSWTVPATPQAAVSPTVDPSVVPVRVFGYRTGYGPGLGVYYYPSYGAYYTYQQPYTTYYTPAPTVVYPPYYGYGYSTYYAPLGPRYIIRPRLGVRVY
jgi:hypothetical protein